MSLSYMFEIVYSELTNLLRMVFGSETHRGSLFARRSFVEALIHARRLGLLPATVIDVGAATRLGLIWLKPMCREENYKYFRERRRFWRKRSMSFWRFRSSNSLWVGLSSTTLFIIWSLTDLSLTIFLTYNIDLWTAQCPKSTWHLSVRRDSSAVTKCTLRPNSVRCRRKD